MSLEVTAILRVGSVSPCLVLLLVVFVARMVTVPILTLGILRSHPSSLLMRIYVAVLLLRHGSAVGILGSSRRARLYYGWRRTIVSLRAAALHTPLASSVWQSLASGNHRLLLVLISSGGILTLRDLLLKRSRMSCRLSLKTSKVSFRPSSG